jgi:ankyrin repeat protein
MEIPQETHSGFALLPSELKIEILKDLAINTSLDDAIQDIKNYMILAKDFADLDDAFVNSQLIEILARRHPYISKVMIAVKLHTKGAGPWLQNYIQSADGRDSVIQVLNYAVLWGTDAELNFLLKNVPSLVNDPVQSRKIMHLFGLTPLMAAASGGRLKSVQKLLKVPGIEINKKDYNDRTALWHAQNPSNPEIKHGLQAIIKLLKEKGAEE